MLVMMPGSHDSYAHRYQVPEWHKSERLDYCDKALPMERMWPRLLRVLRYLLRGDRR